MKQEQTIPAPVAVVEPYVLREIDSDDTVKRVKYFVDIAEKTARVSVQAALAAGYELIRAKQNIKHGLWTAFVMKCGLNVRSATRYMSLAGSVNEQLRVWAEDGAALPLDLIASSARELEGKSLTQLYSDFGIVRKSGAWGGARAGAGRPQLEGGAAAAGAAAVDLRAEAELFGAALKRVEKRVAEALHAKGAARVEA